MHTFLSLIEDLAINIRTECFFTGFFSYAKTNAFFQEEATANCNEVLLGLVYFHPPVAWFRNIWGRF